MNSIYHHLRNGDWEAAHKIAQDLDTKEGAYWHGILHRIEPDPFNAKYWFAKVGTHPIHAALVEHARKLGYDSSNTWNPDRFVDFYDPKNPIAQAVHNLECRILDAYQSQGLAQ